MFIKAASTILSFVLMTSLLSAPDLMQTTEQPAAEAYLSYISEADAQELADQCIAKQLSVGETSWDASTHIYETVCFYDPLGAVNAYLFRVKTEQKKDGYIFVDACGAFPHVQAFGYDCNFMIDEAYQESYHEKIKSEDQVIYHDGLSFLKQEDTGKYKSVMADDYIDMKEAEVKAQYQKRMQQVRKEAKEVSAASEQTNMAQLSTAGSVQPLAQVVYKNQHLSGVSWNDSTNNFNFVPFVGSEFRNENHCGPTAATNLVYYWSILRPGGHRDLFLGPENALRPEKAVFGMLYSGLRTEYSGGTNRQEYIPGIRAFARSRYDDIAGSDSQAEGVFSSVKWSFITTKINNSIPIIISLSGDPKYKDHAILCVGYQECSDGNYLRIADGWSKTISNFYYFKGSIVNACCVWW